MGPTSQDYLSSVTDLVARSNPGEPEFQQAVREVLSTLAPSIEAHPEYRDAKICERMVEPERVIMFRVTWLDDQGEVQVNRGYRVQMSSAIGPYKGGLRFHPSVNLSVLKFLAFEQVFKNALTTLPLGGAKGGSDFDPKGRSDGEVRRFCQAFMTELYRHIGQFTDVPAGDIGVGPREIGYLFGHYKRITNIFAGVLTGKGTDWGGSFERPEATGYGAVYFANEMLTHIGEELDGRRCLISGSGNVAQYTAEKLIELGAIPITFSDSDGLIHDPNGIDREKLDYVMELKNVRRGRIREYAGAFRGVTYVPAEPGNANPLWAIPADCAFPSATQNEITEKDAAAMVDNGVKLVVEGANMPTTPDGVRVLRIGGVLFGPAKAANAGGVAVSGLEMAQDGERLQWSRSHVDAQLRAIVRSIHTQIIETATHYDRTDDYVFGANVAGFEKVARAMHDESTL
jgi:glutamate dehydrogenase (NADP+)